MVQSVKIVEPGEFVWPWAATSGVLVLTAGCGGGGHDAGPPRPTAAIQFAVALLAAWRLDDGDAVGLLGFGPEDAPCVAAVLAGKAPLHGRDTRERIAHLLWIRKTLFSLFGDLDVENAWLRGRHDWLQDRVPMDLLLKGSIEELLLVRDYVDTVAGV